MLVGLRLYFRLFFRHLQKCTVHLDIKALPGVVGTVDFRERITGHQKDCLRLIEQIERIALRCRNGHHRSYDRIKQRGVIVPQVIAAEQLVLNLTQSFRQDQFTKIHRSERRRTQGVYFFR